MLFLRIITISRAIAKSNRSLPTTNTHFNKINTLRFISHNSLKCSNSSLKKDNSKLKNYVVEQYMNYVQYYTNILENKFPSAMKMYRTFSVGMKDFYKDLKTYISLRLKMRGSKTFGSITRQEIELYYKMPSDMWRITPVLILSVIPFGNYLIFPIALLKPKTMLCSHFWSIQQRTEFSMIDLKERLKHNKPVFRTLQIKLDSVKDDAAKQKLSKVIALLGSGVHPCAEDIAACKELFTEGPYQLDSITYAHAGNLLKVHGIRKGLFRKKSLSYRAFILHEMDKAILREGGVQSMNTESLRQACHIRGLNSSHLSNQDMMSWLEEWLQISQVVDSKSYSLLLHCPIFLAYNHPQNWVLIY